MPQRIGLVTSPTGAAIRDVLNTLGRRLPIAEVMLATSAVQGEGAVPQLVQAIADLNRLRPRPDVILVVRGGGSIEDLWAFNDENVVRAVAGSKVPIISGVGHETDFTLADFAADLRAPTPTAAAELATPISAQELQANLQATRTQIEDSMLAMIEDYRNQVAAVQQLLRFQSPVRRIETSRQQVDDLSRRAVAGHSHVLSLAASQLQGLDRRLSALNPLAVLERGYAVVTRQADGVIVRKVAAASGVVRVRVSDGSFGAKVLEDRGSD